MCDCISKLNERLKDQNLKVKVSYVFEGPHAGVHAQMETMYIDKPKRAPKPPILMPTYCPFCGVKVRADADE